MNTSHEWKFGLSECANVMNRKNRCISSRYHLTDQQLAELEFEHRHTTDKRYAGRVKAVYLLGKGWSATRIAQALLIERETVRNHFKR